MDTLAIINALIFSVLFPIFALESGAAVLFVMDYKRFHKKLSKYIAVSWEISGTFLVFYLINFEATYPGLLVPAGTMFLAPVLLAASFIIVRNAFLAFSEYTGGAHDEKRDSKVYAVSTVIAAFLFISMMSASVTGVGVSISTLSINLPAMLINRYNLSITIAMGSVALMAVFVFFEMKNLKYFFGALVLSGLGLLVALPAVPYLFNSMLADPYLNIPPAIIFIAMTVLYIKQSRWAKWLVIPWISASSLAFQFFEYPYLFGGAVNITNYMIQQPSATYVLIISVCGSILVGIGLCILFYARHLSKRSPAKEYKIYPPERKWH